jgi:hypothetical protein
MLKANCAKHCRIFKTQLKNMNSKISLLKPKILLKQSLPTYIAQQNLSKQPIVGVLLARMRVAVYPLIM